MKSGLAVRALAVTRGKREVLKGVDFDVASGEVVALMGVSGAGKTTALRAIAALEPFASGTISVGDFTLRPGPIPPESALRPLRRTLGMVFQGSSLFEHLTVLENVMLAPMHVYRWTTQHAQGVAHNLLDSLGVAACAASYPRQVSGGEAQRVAIARALAPDPKTLLMDEPTSALDPARRGSLGETLRRLAAEGRGLLLATHDVEFARAYADRVVILSGGVVVEQGAAAHMVDHELLRSADTWRAPPG